MFQLGSSPTPILLAKALICMEYILGKRSVHTTIRQPGTPVHFPEIWSGHSERENLKPDG